MSLGEEDAEDLREVFEYIEGLKMSAASSFEAAIVFDRRKRGSLDRLATGLELHIVAVDTEQVEIARNAYRQYGKGSGHVAQLNFGDCFTYALAKVTKEPMLSKGDDFSATDVEWVNV